MSNAQDRWDAAERDYKSERDTPRASECDCCGKMKYDCEDIYVSYVGDTHACADCRGEGDR